MDVNKDHGENCGWCGIVQEDKVDSDFEWPGLS